MTKKIINRLGAVIDTIDNRSGVGGYNGGGGFGGYDEAEGYFD